MTIHNHNLSLVVSCINKGCRVNGRLFCIVERFGVKLVYCVVCERTRCKLLSPKPKPLLTCRRKRKSGSCFVRMNFSWASFCWGNIFVKLDIKLNTFSAFCSHWEIAREGRKGKKVLLGWWFSSDVGTNFSGKLRQILKCMNYDTKTLRKNKFLHIFRIK